MGFADLYLSRYGLPHHEPLPDPLPGTAIMVVIPAYGEKNLMDAVDALAASLPDHIRAEILCVINHPENPPREYLDLNIRSLDLIKQKSGGLKSNLKLYAIYLPDVPHKLAGVGYARKVGMDTAVSRFGLLDNPSGIIVSFDADSLCSDDFLEEVHRFFSDHPGALSANHYFEHPDCFIEDGRRLAPIGLYELHLRYFRMALEWAAHPHAIHTVGSSFAVRVNGYIRAGGMGRHKAGEDFYFLQKMVALGHFWENNRAMVIPSSRESDRVIFGTGATMLRAGVDDRGYLTYPLVLFDHLKQFILSNPWLNADLKNGSWSDNPGDRPDNPLRGYLHESSLLRELEDIEHKTAGPISRRKKFFATLGIFEVLRYLNHSGRHGFPLLAVEGESHKLASRFKECGVDGPSLLRWYREQDHQRGVRRIT